MKACLQLVQTTPCQMKGVKSIVQKTSHVDIGWSLTMMHTMYFWNCRFLRSIARQGRCPSWDLKSCSTVMISNWVHPGYKSSDSRCSPFRHVRSKLSTLNRWGILTFHHKSSHGVSSLAITVGICIEIWSQTPESFEVASKGRVLMWWGLCPDHQGEHWEQLVGSCHYQFLWTPEYPSCDNQKGWP